MRCSRLTLLATLLALLVPSAVAQAAWTTGGAGSQSARAITLPAGNQPVASVSNRNVTVSWAVSNLPGGSPVSGYTVKRYDGSGNVQTIGSACSGTVSALTCTEQAVPGGTWKYSVTPTQANWAGAESSQSTSVTVASPALSFSSSTTVTSLPTTLNGSVANFVPGQTVTFRLDNSSTGTVLSGTVTSSPIPSGGGSNITVTIPAGTLNGAHTVYAVGSSGDVASAAITVTVPYTATTAAWDLRDASAGAAAVNSSAQSAYADGLTFATGNWPTAFATTNYVEFNQNAPLPAGFSVSGGAFNFNFAAGAAADTACFWFEVRRASTGAVVGTHGSSASPVSCQTGTTLKVTSTSIPELNTTDLANDNRIRVYGRESGGRPFTIDLASVSGATPSTAFTLYTSAYTDAAAGTPTTYPWSLSGSGGLAYTTLSNWAAAFSAARYLTVTFPTYIPATATVTGASFKEAYRPTSSGHNACYYLEVYSGATLIGTHGSSAAPISCNSTAGYTTDTVSLPEVNTPARANGLIVKTYFWISGAGTRTTDHDLAQLTINYQ
ncbi:MAG: hypothetical protein QOK25_3060 [Thermoleophilaceae bacterium]|jgi:hypothetical protein|nr:hypothetical protein [Thermoleophilaceae bacterium]